VKANHEDQNFQTSIGDNHEEVKDIDSMENRMKKVEEVKNEE
jgi:hypothetical protein